MFRRGTWCIEQLSGSQLWRRVRIRSRKSGRFSFGPVTEVEDIQASCSGTVHLSFTPSQLFLLNQEFQTTKSELLDLQIQQDFIEQGLALEGAEFLHRKKQLPEEGGHTPYLSTFVPESEIMSFYAQASSWRGIHRLRILPGAVSLAGLFRQVTGETVLVLLLDPAKYQLVAVRDGIPLYNQRLSPDASGTLDMDLIPHALDFAAQILKRDFGVTEYRFSCLGPQRESFDYSIFPDLEQWQPDFSEVMTSENPEEILFYPQLFGGIVADNAYNFTPVEFSRSWKLQGLASVVVGLSGVAALGFLSGWYLLQNDLEQLRAEYSHLSRKVADQRLELTGILPQEEQFQIVDRLISIRSRASEELRLDDLVADIAGSLAREVRITSLTVVRQTEEISGVDLPPPDTENLSAGGPPMPGEAGSLQGKSVAEELQVRPLQVELACMTRGSYDLAAARIQDTIAGLSRIFTMKNVLWRYVEKERRGYLSCDLAPLGLEKEISMP